MGTIHALADARNLTYIDPPSDHQPGDRYEKLTIPGGGLAYLGLDENSFVIVRRDTILNMMPHAVIFGGEIFLGILRQLDAFRVEFLSWHAGEHSGVYTLGELNVLGAICRFYPFGEGGIFWELGRSTKPCLDSTCFGTLLKATAH